MSYRTFALSPKDLWFRLYSPFLFQPVDVSIMAEQRSVLGVVRRFLEDYAGATPTKLKLIDAYMGKYSLLCLIVIQCLTQSAPLVVARFTHIIALFRHENCDASNFFQGYILITGVIQFVYCCLVGTFPFNSFLSGFISCVGYVSFDDSLTFF